MYRRDIVIDEAQKFARLLARLLGLRNQGSFAEADSLYESILRDELALDSDNLTGMSDEDFKLLIATRAYRPNQLDALAKLFYYQVLPLRHNADTLSLLNKTLTIFDVLEKEHHIQSFDNVAIRSKIEQFIKETNA